MDNNVATSFTLKCLIFKRTLFRTQKEHVPNVFTFEFLSTDAFDDSINNFELCQQGRLLNKFQELKHENESDRIYKNPQPSNEIGATPRECLPLFLLVVIKCTAYWSPNSLFR